MKRILLIGAAVLAVFTIWYYWQYPLNTRVQITSMDPQTQAQIAEHVFTVELAVTKAEKYQGLSGRDPLPENHGMLFIYDHTERYGFVMRDMTFPLDFIWIDGDRVADITENAPVEEGDQLTSYQPSVPVDKILEVNAGTVERLGIQVGDTFKVLKR